MNTKSVLNQAVNDADKEWEEYLNKSRKGEGSFIRVSTILENNQTDKSYVIIREEYFREITELLRKLSK